ncbi:hypothetical protein J5U23_00679 [Saccharolobus shibatae B12]|uniref:Uncharacterized protein n=2 Tax=Saccharolobus shibatae TaxID=2286 RepID=A0A8F5GSY5_SACSH|nr:hypothetical protein J5U23_00679 [Saccharolobus shibatae B12]
MQEGHGIMIAKNIEEYMIDAYKFSISPCLLEVKHVVPSKSTVFYKRLQKTVVGEEPCDAKEVFISISSYIT